MAHDFLIVGAGITGATAARLLLDAGKSVLVIDRRKDIAGNCHDYKRDGILVNSFAGHIFHTNSARVWQFVQRFAEWRQYEHRVKAKIGEKVYSFPPNLMTLQQLDLKPDSEYSRMMITNMFFKGYSEKQWGRKWEDVPAGAKKRMSIRNTWDDRYFTDIYQGLPVGGYTEMIGAMMDGVDLELGVDYLKDELYWNEKATQVIYTGSLDEYYQYDLGRLEYRSARFEWETSSCESLLGCATMNYPSDLLPYTREMEWKHFGYQKADFTIVTREYPEAYNGANERLWPVETQANRTLYDQYQARVINSGWFHVGGRLGSYKYLNMDQAVAAAMQLVEKITRGVKEYVL